MSALVLLEIYQPPKSAVDQVLDFMEGFLGPFVPLVLLLLASVALLGLGMAVRPAGRPKGGKRRMPPGWVQYKTTSVFTQDTVPAGLLKRHSTKRGAWGKVRVLEGQMRLRYLDSVAHDQSEAEYILQAGGNDVMDLPPEAPHEVELMAGDVKFQVEFYKDSGAVMPGAAGAAQ